MFFKKFLAGAMAAMMLTGLGATGASAAKETTEKATDYQAYAANLDKTAYSGSDLGAAYTKEATTFKVWSPSAESVRVNIFEHGSDGEGDAGSVMSRALTLDKKTGVWSVTIKEDLLNKYYTYSVKNDGKVQETADVYAKACGVNGERSMIVDLDSTDPEGWENDTHVLVQSQTDASVWEISVADFSSSDSSGVSDEYKGKYLAFAQEGTTVNGVQGASSTCIDYLKKLGVKYVQIMPFYDFGSVDESKDISEQYNWGYDPVNYNCPEGSYSTDPYNGTTRIKECKQMIQALHSAGIGVIMDVVYNHTYNTDSCFQKTVPNYYYRMNEDGTFSNGSGCSNDTASEHLMFRKYMMDSVTYWAEEYHIDGFRFDLMGLHDVTTMNDIREALDNLYEDGSGKQIIMYGEAWNMATNCDDGTILANQNNLKQLSDRIGAFDDTIRDAIKGSTGGTDKSFVQQGTGRAALKTGISAQCDGWANVPTQCVTYASCHDNLCLYDKLVGSVYGTDGDYRKRYEDLVAMNKLSAAIVLTSQGIPFMLGGEEFCRSKDGDGNSYASSREENALDWENVDLFSDVMEYYRGLYKIRSIFAAFSDPTAATAAALEYIDDPPTGVTGYVINGVEGDVWSKMCVIFNGSDDAQNISVDGEWAVLADNETAGLRNINTVTDSVQVQAHSAVIMVDAQSYDASGISDSEGVVVVNYYDNKSGELIKKQTLSGELGTSYDVSELASSLSYDVKRTSGSAVGVFMDNVATADVYVEEYDGEMSSVTFEFVNEETGEELADSYLVSNRVGEQYYTPDLPSIEGYSLMLDELPKDGAGIIESAPKTVTYKYKKLSDDADKSVCTVNAVYMDDSGEIIDTVTVTGTAGESYALSQNEYEDKLLTGVPEKANGTFAEGEINVVFSYESTPDPLKQILPYVIVCASVIVALCAASTVYSFVKRKKRLMAGLDIDEDCGESADKAEP